MRYVNQICFYFNQSLLKFFLFHLIHIGVGSKGPCRTKVPFIFSARLYFFNLTFDKNNGGGAKNKRSEEKEKQHHRRCFHQNYCSPSPTGAASKKNFQNNPVVKQKSIY